MRQSVKKILLQEGVQGFYRGASSVAVGTMIQRGMVMSTFELIYTGAADDESLTKEIEYTGGLQRRTILGGMCAGLVRSIIECPFEYVKVRQMTG